MFYASIVFEIFAYKYDFFVQLVQSILKYNRGIYMQNVLLRLREVQPSLSSTERQIAQFILENPDETTTLTIRDLARRSFSSPSSVVRICRVIGFQGYKELRHALTLELATLGENGSHREKDITPQDSLQEIVDKVTHKNIQSLLDTQRLLLLDELEQCVELIANARTVLLFGIGSSLCVAKDTYLKFLRLDKPCVVNEDSHSQLLQARNATAQDVGIVFSYSGQTMEMIQCIKEMKAGGMRRDRCARDGTCRRHHGRNAGTLVQRRAPLGCQLRQALSAGGCRKASVEPPGWRVSHIYCCVDSDTDRNVCRQRRQALSVGGDRQEQRQARLLQQGQLPVVQPRRRRRFPKHPQCR
jgi:DNA-binding MurR/RpiR family transcriptional regulator